MGGKKKQATVGILVAGAVLAVVVLGYSLLRGRDSGTDTSVPAVGQVGRAVEVGGIEFIVVRSYDSNGTDSERPQFQHVFTIARVSLTNKTDQPVMVRPGDFSLLAEGEEIPLKPLSYVIDSLAETSVQPGAVLEGALSWETPSRCRTRYLVYHSPDGKSTTIDLLKKAE